MLVLTGIVIGYGVALFAGIGFAEQPGGEPYYELVLYHDPESRAPPHKGLEIPLKAF